MNEVLYKEASFFIEDVKQYTPNKDLISKDINKFKYIKENNRMIVITVDNVKNGYIIQGNNERWIAKDYEEVKNLVLHILEEKEYDDNN